MFIRMIPFQTDASRLGDATQVMDRMLPKISQLPGCQRCQFLVHERDGQCALLVYWETQGDAEATAGIIGPEMIPALNRIAVRPVEPVLYKVY